MVLATEIASQASCAVAVDALVVQLEEATASTRTTTATMYAGGV